jgi:hypothetical protein
MTASDPGNPPVTAKDGGMSNKNQHWGSTLGDFLHEEGIYKAAKAKAVKLEQLRQAFLAGSCGHLLRSSFFFSHGDTLTHFAISVNSSLNYPR